MDYYFDRCQEKDIKKIASLCEEMRMDEEEGEPPNRVWLGAENNFHMDYRPLEKLPLFLQTQSVDFSNPEVKRLIRKISKITGSEVYLTHNKRIKLDLSKLS